MGVGKMPATPAMLKARQMPMTPAAIKQYGQPTTPKIDGETEPPPKEASPRGDEANDASPKGEVEDQQVLASNYARKRRKVDEEKAEPVEPVKEEKTQGGVRIGMSFSEWKSVKQASQD